MLDHLARAAEIPGAGLTALPEELVSAGQPTVLRGAVTDWPLVRSGLQSDEAAVDYLGRFYREQPVEMLLAGPSVQGRFSYRPDSKEMNFERSSESLAAVLDGILEQREAEHRVGVALQAISVADVLPGLEAENATPLVPAGTAGRMWIGNRVSVAPHFDVADNLACVAVGRRRFILFPPEHSANLYPGPLDVTPAGVPISMVPLDEPELDRFPRYREALAAAFVADLEPGDALYIPYLWWHGVKSLAPFNILVNYWWSRDQARAPYPYVPLLHLAYQLYRDMPPEHRQAWRALYDHYVFQTGGDPMAPLSPPHREADRNVSADGLAKLRQVIRDLLA